MIPGGGASSAAYRLGPGAARALAGGIARGLIPGVGLALALGWLASECIGKQDGQWVRTCGPQMPKPSDGFEWSTPSYTIFNQKMWVSSAEAACVGSAPYWNPDHPGRVVFTSVNLDGMVCVGQIVHKQTGELMFDNWNYAALEKRPGGCPVGWYSTSAGCVQGPPPATVTPEEIEEIMAPKPLPQQLPPGFPYPLDPLAPSIWNPEPITETPPGQAPKSRPLRVPQGNPQAVPNTDPQQYRQPVTRWTHSPTQAEPWRMDVRPEEITTESPTGMTDPQSVTSGSPNGDKPEQFDLCKEHPDIIACQVFKPDELQPLPVPNKQVPLSLNAEGGFPTGGSCPQPKVVQLMGQTFSFSMQPLCDFAIGIKPLLIGFAWLSAALVFLGVARREG